MPINPSSPLTKDVCLNCGTALEADVLYCPQCGQRTLEVPLTLKSIVSDFLGTIFSLDAKIWVTLKDLFIPGKVSSRYLAGQRKSYMNPIKLLVILNIIYIVFMGSVFEASMQSSFKVNADEEGGMLLKIDELATSNRLLTEISENGIIPENHQNQFDFLTEKGFIVYDSIECAQDEYLLDSLEMPFTDRKVDYRDIQYGQQHDFEAVFKKYGITDYWEKQILRKLPVFQSPETIQRTFTSLMVKNFNLLNFLVIPFAALLFRLFFWKERYTAHLVHFMYIAAFGSLLSILFGIPAMFMGGDNQIATIFSIGSTIFSLLYIFLTYFFLYRQFWKTLIKCIFIIPVYMIISILVMMLVIVGAFFLA